jgi:hypothetical protein
MKQRSRKQRTSRVRSPRWSEIRRRVALMWWSFATDREYLWSNDA